MELTNLTKKGSRLLPLRSMVPLNLYGTRFIQNRPYTNIIALYQSFMRKERESHGPVTDLMWLIIVRSREVVKRFLKMWYNTVLLNCSSAPGASLCTYINQSVIRLY